MSGKPEDSSTGNPQSHSEPVFDVFISHASTDKVVARKLAAELRHRGIRCWLDEQNFTAGENWEERNREAINKSRVGLVLLSRKTLPSEPEVSKEWSAIQESAWRRPDFSICPVQLEDVDMPAFLRRWQGLRLSRQPRDMEKAADDIAAIVGRSPSEQMTAPSERDLSETAKRFSEITEALRESRQKDTMIYG